MGEYTQLTTEQRYEISAYIKAGMNKKYIYTTLKIHRSTLYRELKRNSTKTGKYNPQYAQESCNIRKERLNLPRKFTREKKKIIDKYLKEEQWSPQQIKGYCNKNNIEMVSTERIYQYIRKDKQSGGNLYKHLRHKLKHRKRALGTSKIKIKDRVSIAERPEIINNKQRFGDWEVDTIIGKNQKGAIVTIVERTTGFFMIRKLKQGENATNLSNELINMLLPYKKQILSITSDNGLEFAEHKKISKKLNCKFYFADPYCSWQRGVSEYTNKLVRQYVPKKTDFNMINNKQLIHIQYKINKRPRKKLDYNSPFRKFYKFLDM